jgi:hypothetical protein
LFELLGVLLEFLTKFRDRSFSVLKF